MVNDNFKMVGKLSIAKNGEIVREIDNVVVTTGKAWVAQRMNNANTVMSHQAIGTGTNAAIVANTSLQTELVRVALTSATVTSTAIAYVATYAAGTGTGAITEAGMFNASSGGTMLCRTKFSVINKGADDSMTITWTITVS